MRRNSSKTTRIHQPPAPPCWFRTVFYISFLAWLVLQAATEYYTITALHAYNQMTLFEIEKQVDSALVNVVVVGLLTAMLVVFFVYGILAVRKLVVICSAAFLGTLIILNILAGGVLMSSRFTLRVGPMSYGKRVMTIHHPNVSEAHWFAEIDSWASAFPLSSQTDSGPPAALTAPTVSSAADGSASATTPAQSRAAAAAVTARPANTTNTTDSRLTWRALYAESKLLHLLGFFQRNAFCCGVSSVGDFGAHGARVPPSCRCRDDPAHALRPQCSALAHLLADGHVGAVWSSGCTDVVASFMGGVNHLTYLLAVTVVFQLAVMLLGIVMGLNMPDSKADDSDDDADDY